MTHAHKDNSMMIGDSIEADIQGALGIGMKAIHCNFDASTISSNEFISVTSLLEIKTIL